MFFVGTYQALHAHTYKSEWIVNYGYIHHTIKDAYIFSSLNKDTKVCIFVANDYALSISSYGNVIIDVYHVPIYDANLLSLPQLTSCIYVWLNNVAPLPMLDVMPIMITN